MNATRKLLVLECNLDDLNPEFFPHVIERLLSIGARDAWLTPIIMKSGRPGQILSALIDPQLREQATALLFRETSTLGVRVQEVEREELSREIVQVTTKYGTIPLKIARTAEGETLNAKPEVSSCIELATAQGVPLKEIYAEVLKEFSRTTAGQP